MKKFAALELGLDDDMLSYRLRQITLLLPDLSERRLHPLHLCCCSHLGLPQWSTLCKVPIALSALVSSKGLSGQGSYYGHANDLHRLHAISLRMCCGRQIQIAHQRSMHAQACVDKIHLTEV